LILVALEIEFQHVDAPGPRLGAHDARIDNRVVSDRGRRANKPHEGRHPAIHRNSTFISRFT
jgi:hypothetical protein